VSPRSSGLYSRRPFPSRDLASWPRLFKVVLPRTLRSHQSLSSSTHRALKPASAAATLALAATYTIRATALFWTRSSSSGAQGRNETLGVVLVHSLPLFILLPNRSLLPCSAAFCSLTIVGRHVTRPSIPAVHVICACHACRPQPIPTCFFAL